MREGRRARRVAASTRNTESDLRTNHHQMSKTKGGDGAEPRGGDQQRNRSAGQRTERGKKKNKISLQQKETDFDEFQMTDS